MRRQSLNTSGGSSAKKAGPHSDSDCYFSRRQPAIVCGVNRFVKTAELEYGKLDCQLIEMESIGEMPAVAQKLKNDSHRPHDKHIRYKGENGM
ncbi:hypothetical protein QNN00_18980 [Bacillus velezensis]|nr:hypothetical protein [Bacillus velezensis]